MPTYTTNYNLAKPLVNSAVDQDLWGNELNSDMDIIDTTMKSISDSVTPLATILATVYPVGSYYINETVSTNPATLFGFGTWTAVQDKFIVGRGSTYTSTGGAATVTLSDANHAPHTHNSMAVTTGGGGYVGGTPNTGGGSSADGWVSTGSGGNQIAITSSQGSATPFSIIPPYQAAYIWKRTA